MCDVVDCLGDGISPRVAGTVASRPRWRAAALVGCGPGDPVKTWIDRDAAAIYCTSASVSAQVPPVAAELPTVTVPKQFVLRDFAPVDLHDLGFAPQTTVCAALMMPSGDVVAREFDELTAAREERDALVNQMRRKDPCLCEQLRALELMWFDPSCHDTPVQFGCTIDDVLAQRALGDSLGKIEAWRSATRVRPRHWRLAGTTDRPAVFEHRLRRIRRRYPGPVEMFDSSRPATSGPSTQLVNALLKAPSVVMVMRIDRGRSLMVVREPTRGALVLDLFEKPIYQDAGVAMLGALDDAHPDLYMELLRKPSVGYSPPPEAMEARTVELNFPGLTRTEDALQGLARFFGVKTPSTVAAETAALVDRVSWTVARATTRGPPDVRAPAALGGRASLGERGPRGEVDPALHAAEALRTTRALCSRRARRARAAQGGRSEA